MSNDNNGPIFNLTCCCCGERTRGRQWYNRDTGFGLCAACVDYCGRKMTPEEFLSLYGIKGVHYMVEEHAHA